MSRAQFILHLAPMQSDVPPIIRLRGALKTVSRRFGLRCTRIEEITPESSIDVSEREKQPHGRNPDASFATGLTEATSEISTRQNLSSANGNAKNVAT